MATKVTVGKLQVSVTESVTVNGVEHTYNSVRSVAGINNVAHRIVRTDASGTELTLLSFHASASAGHLSGAGGQFIDGQAKYIRITNLDDTNLLRLVVRSTSKCASFQLAAGETIVFNNGKVEGRADTTISQIAYTDIDAIGVIGKNAADSANAAVDVEYFVAAIQS
tara:strand:- start:46 stop:546 length:501 start_codon:yes stop_codon:yes gene_type:complete